MSAPLHSAALLILALASAGCATSTSTTSTDDVVEVPFVEQEATYDRGLAAASAVLSFHEVEFDRRALRRDLLPREEAGTRGLEFSLALYERGLFPLVREDAGPEWLESAARAGHPVVVLLTTSLQERLRLYHYVVVTRAGEKSYRIHDGQEAHREVTREDFLSEWRAAGSWAVVAIDPQDPPAGGLPLTAGEQARIGYMAQGKGLLEAAALRYRAALERDPEVAEVAGNLGGVLLDLGRPQEALQVYEVALSKSPNDVRLLNDTAWAIHEVARRVPATPERELRRAEVLATRACEEAEGDLLEVAQDTLRQVRRLLAERAAADSAESVSGPFEPGPEPAPGPALQPTSGLAGRGR